MNLNITMEMIEKCPKKPWDWNSISWKPNLTLDIIEAHPDKPWNWYMISGNKFTHENLECFQKLLRKDMFQLFYDNALGCSEYSALVVSQMF